MSKRSTQSGSDEMPKAYDPAQAEEKWYQFWMERGYFTPQIDRTKKPFSIIMPPPNVTGELHLGHALTATVEDIMVRWHRMKSDPTLWLPGVDHASIAAQVVLENRLLEEGLSRHDLGRERFLERMWDFMNQTRHIITEQHKRLGASCDWTRERFTMDEGPARAVRTTFVNLYQKGLIYRGERLINWCPRCMTALSDLEVDHEETLGNLYYVRYPLQGQRKEYVTIATTRPETIVADTAVAVHPEDKRYKRLLGRHAILPIIGRKLPIVADLAIDPHFGTGALKVTPAHDPVDFEIGERHNLPAINAIGTDGSMNGEAGPYAGLDRFETRERIVADLEKLSLLERVESHVHAIGHCQRCKTIIEPLISKQWFINIRPLALPAIEAVLDGRITFVPERFTKTYLNWMENIRDWCISRQLWWGHRIPVWYCQACGEVIVALEDPTACTRCGSRELEQDPDVLDTWFSSALWPHSTLGWPEKTEDFEYFYPTSVMETGYDIIFFWVARMIMMGLENTKQVPFHTVYLHGLVRDEKGEKMSKSKGNVINPLEAMREFGTDALRYTLSTGSTPGNDMKLSSQRMAAARNFANKLWNASRFVISQAMAGEGLSAHQSEDLSLEDRWILSLLNKLVKNVNELMEIYQFGEAGRQIYEFLWGEFCDWYIEMAKIRLRRDEKARSHQPSPLPVLVRVLETSLRLLHPYMPFVTEEIWQRLTEHFGLKKALGVESVMIASFPTADESSLDIKAEWQMGLIIDTVRAIRNIRAQYNVEASKWVDAILVAGECQPLLELMREPISALARTKPLTIVSELPEKPTQAVSVVAEDVEIYVPLADLVDLVSERQRLFREIEEAQKEIERAQSKLANQDFISKAPATVVEKEREKREGYQQKLAKLRERLQSLER